MKAAVLRKLNVAMEIEEVDLALPFEREVLVRVAVVGLCHSGLHVFAGSYPGVLPTILGHEVAGVVERVGSQVHRVRPGDHAGLSLSFNRGYCEHCYGGNPQRCGTPEASRRPGEPARVTRGAEAIADMRAAQLARTVIAFDH